jgi:hypothetical protein
MDEAEELHRRGYVKLAPRSPYDQKGRLHQSLNNFPTLPEHHAAVIEKRILQLQERVSLDLQSLKNQGRYPQQICASCARQVRLGRRDLRYAGWIRLGEDDWLCRDCLQSLIGKGKSHGCH